MRIYTAPTARGRKMRVGTVCFDTGRMTFFLGYHDCPSCQAHSKILVGIDEAREFSSKFGRTKTKLRHKIGKQLLKS